jgi:ribosomal protein S18 acetylase RimI-like enzyme
MTFVVTHWRQMYHSDIPRLLDIQDEAYPWHKEDRTVFEDRLALYPQGCLVLEIGGEIIGYILSHPWRADDPPPLDTQLGKLPERPGTYYLHDLALMASAFGKGHGARVVRHLAETAGAMDYRSMSLIAVNQSAPFWQKHGFVPRPLASVAAKLEGYGEGAVFMTCPLPLEN